MRAWSYAAQRIIGRCFLAVLVVILLSVFPLSAQSSSNQKGTYPAIHIVTPESATGTLPPAGLICTGSSTSVYYECAKQVIQFNSNGGNGIRALLSAAPDVGPSNWTTQYISHRDPDNPRDGNFSFHKDIVCNKGDRLRLNRQTNYFYCEQRGKDNFCPIGNPVSPFSGEKIERSIDLARGGIFPVTFERFYHSQTSAISQQLDGVNTSIGNHWDHSYGTVLTGMLTEHMGYTWETGTGSEASIDQFLKEHYSNAPDTFLQALTLYRPNGELLHFTNVYDPAAKCFVSPEWESVDRESPGYLTMTDVCDLSSEYVFTDRINISSVFDSSGRLLRMQHPTGVSHELVYDEGILSEIRHSLGGYFTFLYDQGRVSAITDTVTNDTWGYRYDVHDNLEYVDYPDGTTLQYHYENQSIPYALTGITDRRGIRYSHYYYDNQARVEAEYHGTRTDVVADRIEGIEIEYGLGYGTLTELTTSRGYTTGYRKTKLNGQDLLLRIDGPGCLNCGRTGIARDYYQESYDLKSITDNGLKTRYADYDQNGQPGTVIEAADSSPDVSRTKTYTYHPRFLNKLTSVSEPSVYPGRHKLTTYTYDDFGNTTSITITGYKPDGTPVSRVQSLSYQGPYAQLTEIDGPRSDVADVYVIEYYTDTRLEGYNRARMKKLAGPMGVALYDNISYTPTGKIASYTTGTNLQVDLGYYPGSDRLESQTLTDLSTGESRATRWTYLETGEVESITQGHATADATTLIFRYDDGRRLTRVYDGFNNFIEYVLDTEGNVIHKNIHDHAGTLKKTLSQSFDAYNRLDISAQANESRDQDFSPDGTLDLETNGKGIVTDYSYDALRRLTSITHDVGGTDRASANALIQFGYDGQDNLVAVTDPNGGRTEYVYDDLGNLLSLSSPDTGTTVYTHDEAGYVTAATDAKGQTFNYRYDALGRLVQMDVDGEVDDVSYVYDSCENGMGKLCSVTRGAVTISYEYNAFGDIKTSTQTAETFFFYEQAQARVSYTYDAAGRIQEMNYPSGNTVSYTYDVAGNVHSVILNAGEKYLVTGSQYYPFGPEHIIERGNGSSDIAYRDEAYRPWIIGNGGYYYDVIYYDANGNPATFYSSEGGKAHNYDALDRLDRSSGPFGSREYAYDINGNRIGKASESVTKSYSYTANSNRMNANAGTMVVLDANGNTTRLNGMSISYTADNRVKGVSGHAYYTYNGLGERVMKGLRAHGTAGTYSIMSKTLYFFGLDGKLLAETGSSGKVKQEYIYMNDTLLATVVYKPNTDEPILNADMDGDGAVGVEDFLIWYFNHYMAGDLRKEVNGDERLDFDDLNIVLDCALSGGNAPGCFASSYSKSIYYAHNDHLGTPHMLSDGNGMPVWSAVYDPYGRATVNEDVDNDGSKVTLNFRFPGQYHDAESGLYYNYFRYYDPDTGRYITSDPIGLDGGFNTYAYVENSPGRYTDPVGLKKVRGRGGFPSMAGRGVGRAGVFGCLIGCVSYTDGDSEAQASLEPTIGGGFLICGPKKEKRKKTDSCEIDEENRSLYDPNGDNVVEFSPGYAPKGAGIGVSLGRDGKHCVAVGLFTGISVPVSINLGNLSE